VAENPDDRDDLPERTFVAVLQNIGVPSWILDEDGRFVWANKAYAGLYGGRHGEHIGASFTPTTRDEAERRLRRLGRRSTRAGSTVHVDVEMLAHDGRRVVSRISAVRLQPGTFRGAIFGVTLATSGVESRTPTQLTPRQLEVLQFLARGVSTAEVASDLHLSVQTVRNHIRALLRAFNANSRLEVVAKARAQGLVAH
jgi:PAS domain S-box-containing protein